jgi:hypothetical protein
VRRRGLCFGERTDQTVSRENRSPELLGSSLVLKRHADSRDAGQNKIERSGVGLKKQHVFMFYSNF